jgi:signal transduction histidine kinase/ActR/RegA family two-component response regulator
MARCRRNHLVEADPGPPRHGAARTRILVLPLTAADGVAIAKLLDSVDVSCIVFASMAELCTALDSGADSLILSEEAMLAHSAQLLASLAAQPMWSELPVIVLSKPGRESDVFAGIMPRLGNVSVIERPVRMSTLLALVRSSLRARARQYQLRDYLLEREQLLESERHARGDAERAGRIKDEFLATLSHELRTPLNAVLGWTRVLRKGKGHSEEVATGLAVIERNARSQAQIIGDLLDMSSIISGKVRLDLRPMDLAAVLDAAAETVRPAAEAKGIRLQVMHDAAMPAMKGDINRLQQVMWNLLANAVKFTPQGGAVSAALSCDGNQLSVQVADNGEGIDPMFLPHIFDRFRQADASSARRHGGLGLGLSIVRQLVELHGGTVSAHSAGTGMGSTFVVRLPVASASTTAADSTGPWRALDHSEPADSGATVDLAGLRVLVVDDEPDSRALLERLLQECQASVVTAGSADEAMNVLAREAPHLLVSDIGMPGTDGYALLRQIRALENGRASIPAIAVTAYVRSEDKVLAARAGFQAHLSKPVDPVELQGTVERLARRSAVHPG